MSWRLEETYCYSKTSKRPSDDAGGKILKGVTDYLILARRPASIVINKKKKKLKKNKLAAPVYHRIKLKESEKKGKYLDLAKELKKYGT